MISSFIKECITSEQEAIAKQVSCLVKDLKQISSPLETNNLSSNIYDLVACIENIVENTAATIDDANDLDDHDYYKIDELIGILHTIKTELLAINETGFEEINSWKSKLTMACYDVVKVL
jgi:hypothetical protein